MPFPERRDPRFYRLRTVAYFLDFFFFHDGGVWHQIWFHFRGLGTKHAM